MMASSIAEVQKRKEDDIQRKYEPPPGSKDEALQKQRESDAAKSIQRTYRGYRLRRELKGLSLDPASRWTEAIKEAQYRHLIQSAASQKADAETLSTTSPVKAPPRRSSTARSNWTFAGSVARRANKDEESSLSESSSSSSLPDHDQLSPSRKQKAARKAKKLAAKQERVKSAKMMDLSYFLEMVDVKHRYGSNLRKYHAEWKSRPTHENFFRWLDHGEARNLDLSNCTRERLDKMQVRYLGREERRLYEVVVGKQGKLVWRKDGQRVDTTNEWRDSVEGIVRTGDAPPLWADRPMFARGSSESSALNSDLEDQVRAEAEQAETTKSSADEEPKRHASIRDRLTSPLSGKNKEKMPKQKWIFVSILTDPFLRDQANDHNSGSRHKEQPLHWHQADRRFPT